MQSFQIQPQIIASTTDASQNLFRRLDGLNLRLVFAESCTAGLVSALLAGNSGVSNYLCGSAVTYQNATKEKWLGIDPEQIRKHSAVSGQVTESMARAVLFNTPHADCSVAVTGHLQSEIEPDGSLIWIAGARREQADFKTFESKRFLLKNGTRVERQWEAAQYVLRFAISMISATEPAGSEE